MLIYELDKWNGMNESRITPIDIDMFLSLLDAYCHNPKYFLYKNIVKPKTKIGFFFKSAKKIDSFLEDMEINGIPKDKSYPDRDESLFCYNYEEKYGTVYYVFPFLNSLLALSTSSGEPEVLENCKKGYWKGLVKWLDNLPNRELWTDYPCLLIEKELWDTFKENRI
jgi:hypothetical protein